MKTELSITADNFESEVIQSKLPVLVDFWAEWCMPCKMLAPSMEALSKTYDGRIKIVYVDVDAQNELASRFGIISIPTFKDGAEYRKKVGNVPKHEIENLFKDLV